MRSDLLPTSHSRHVGRLIISGKNDLPPLRADDLRLRAANDDETNLALSLLILALLIGGFALLGVAIAMIGRAA
ncbi:hypothetical protein ACQVP2_22495 [Methylobacterium aquaticum]|uniref:hypothetical protein n=1 Tax=Methylobacterium aquaticum TaxID=270351 RepID=UPI003D1809F5